MENYTKLRVIGKGSYGEVWLVKHKKDRKQYVLKKINLYNASKRERQSAEQEAKLLSKLKHPNIVSYKDSFETEDGTLYIAMGYCEGGDLYSRLKEQKGELLEERQIVEWFVQIAMALQYLHERNILHRDLKTQNIFLSKSKIIKVGDLGIARVLEHSSDMASTVIGTPYYMSPELFSNKSYNHKSDVWALGCCVYEMTTLKHAFSAKDMNSLVYKILRGKMPPMPKKYSEELVKLIKAMLNHNPDRRPSVNKILRDPYIKYNIALFLESSTKEKRPVRSSNKERIEREKISDVQPKKDVPDGSSDQQKRARPLPVPSSESKESNLQDNNKHRVFKPHQSSDDVVISVNTESMSEINNKSSSSVRDTSPCQKQRGSRATRNSVERLYSSEESTRSQSQEKPPTSAGSRRNSSECEKILLLSASSSSQCLKNKSPERRRGSKSVLDNAKIVNKPRPLPPRDPVTPRESNKEPKCSKSSRGGNNGNHKNGYGSGASNSQDNHTPRPVTSARERRRERKERETPRAPVSARSVDLKMQRHSLDSGPHLIRPQAGSKSEDYSRSGVSKQIETIVEEDNEIHKSRNDQPSFKKVEKPRRRQPSLDNDSSEAGSGDEDQPDGLQQKENKRNGKPPLSKPNLLVSPSQLGSKAMNSAHNGSLRPGRDPLKALHPPSNPTTPENDSGGEESSGKERDMDNLISALNTTLLMNKVKSSDDDDDDDDDTYDDNIDPEPPGGTKFIHRLPKIHEQKEKENSMQMLEVENVDGSPDKFNVSVRSPQAGIKTMTTTGRLWARITELRKDCIRGLGVEKIKRAYDILDNFDAEELEPQLIQLLGQKDFDLYSGKIWQLKFCEEAAFGLI